MASEVEICNQALSHIGLYSRITSIIAPASKEARECALKYPTCRDMTLEAHDWSFARKRRVLNLDDSEYSGWMYAYQQPTDCIMPRRIYDPAVGSLEINGMASNADLIKYECVSNNDLNRNLILTNQEDAELIYTAQVRDVNRFSASFRLALSHLLASEIAVALRGKSEYQARELQIFSAIIANAKTIDSQRGYETPQGYCSLLAARD